VTISRRSAKKRGYSSRWSSRPAVTFAVAAWLQCADENDTMGSFFNTPLTPEERKVADVEGWILGVVV